MFLLPPRIRQLLEKNREITEREYYLDDQLLPIPPEIESDIPPAPSLRERWYSLSDREREVLALVFMGYKNRDVAQALGVGYSTIGTHLQNIFHKFSLRSRGELRRALSGWRAEDWWRKHHF